MNLQGRYRAARAAKNVKREMWKRKDMMEHKEAQGALPSPA